MRLIDADELRKVFKKYPFFTEVHLHYARELIDNAPTVIPEDFMNSYEEGYERAKKDFERLTGKCKKCDYRKFTETFVDGIVEVMNKNGITSVEQLSEIIRGAEE